MESGSDRHRESLKIKGDADARLYETLPLVTAQPRPNAKAPVITPMRPFRPARALHAPLGLWCCRGPVPAASGPEPQGNLREFKTKPTQHSVKELLSIGIQ